MINEAKNEHSNSEFFVQNMKEITLDKKFDLVFFIASFHHLKSLEERIDVLKNLKKYLKKDSIIFMTNWSLNSELNSKKYFSSMTPNSENEF
jgi:trans-aconitate methyltransferase